MAAADPVANPVTEIWQNRGFEDSWTDHSAKTYERSFRVLTTLMITGNVAVLAKAGLPQLKDTYVDQDGQVDATAICVHRTGGPDQNDPKTWVVRCRYMTDAVSNPLNLDPEIEWGESKFQLAVYQQLDALGNLDVTDDGIIKNSAADPYLPALTKDDTRVTLRITRNEPTFNEALFKEFRDAVNSDDFQGYAAGQVKCDTISGQKVIYPGQQAQAYFRVTYHFAFKKLPDTWQLRVIDAGLAEKNLVIPNISQRKVIQSQGHPVTVPRMLDGNGAVLPVGGNPVYNTFRVYQSRPFAALNLPDATV